MTELKIPAVILRERRKKNLTQEELAAAIGVSPQAISNWERGGYPDITLLPRIANFFGITVDELIGNDAVTREEELQEYLRRYNKADNPEKLRLSKEFYQKFPSDFIAAETLAQSIILNKDSREENLPLLRETCEKIIAECTLEYTRMNAIDYMCIACPDDEWDKWRQMCARFYSSYEGEVLEERLWQRGRYEECQKRRKTNNLLLLMHYLGRNDMRYYEQDNHTFDCPGETADWQLHKIRILELLGNGSIPEAWLGCRAEWSLKAAGAMIGDGKTAEGFSLLEQAFALYEQWIAIPDKQPLALGGIDIYGDAKIEKTGDMIQYADGTKEWTPYLWLFWQNKHDIERALASWPWFDCVRDDPRYHAAYERARALAGLS